MRRFCFRRHKRGARAGEPVADAAIPAFSLAIRAIDELQRRATSRGSLWAGACLAAKELSCYERSGTRLPPMSRLRPLVLAP